jgi:predicted nucleic acid-binding protein
MLKVVSNTTPLIALSKISKLHLLRDLYNIIIIPTAVYEEYQNGKDKDFYVDISRIDWIKIIAIESQKASEYILDLDRGEAEAIVLAEEMNADLLLMDEISGRQYARLKSLKITGTIGVLLKAREKKLIPAVIPLAMELRSKGIWLNDKIINHIKEIEQTNLPTVL